MLSSKTKIRRHVTFMMLKLFIPAFTGTACMCFWATPAAPENFNDALLCLWPFSWMMAKCPRKLFLLAGVATWRMAPLLCQVYCSRRTQARLCASSLARLIAGPWWMSATVTHKLPIHTSITGGAFDEPRLSFSQRMSFFFHFLFQIPCYPRSSVYSSNRSYQLISL